MPAGATADCYRMASALAVFRESRKVTLGQIVDETKIGIAALRAIEAGEYCQLPGGIYNISYIRQYARAVGYDEETLLADYRAKVDPPPC